MSNVKPSARLAANSKVAKDYEAPAGVEDNRTAAEIERDMEQVREELTATVNELAARLNPQVLKEDLIQSIKGQFETVKTKAQAFANDAAAGDKKAIGIIAGASLGLAALVARKILK